MRAALAAPPHWEFERRAHAAGHSLVAGVDEAGRGPLAGPVIAVAVILPMECDLPGLADSKALSQLQRERLFDLVIERAVAVGVGSVEPERIDAVNILRATHEAMAMAVAALPRQPAFALVDGLPVNGLPCPHQAVVQGDATCASIAAASIVAKVLRDQTMAFFDACYPGYGLARNKGYPTPDHLDALRRLGPCPIHRLSFRPVAEAAGAVGNQLKLWEC